MKIHTIGIDLGKTNFHLVGLNERGEVVVRKRFSRTQLLRFTANRKVHMIGMESCGGSHFLARAPEEQGHEVRLMPGRLSGLFRPEFRERRLLELERQQLVWNGDVTAKWIWEEEDPE